MRLLQRYILAELLRVFLFVVIAVTVLLIFIGAFREAHDSGLGALQVLQILPYIVPSLLPYTIPATLLLTVTVVYGRMAGDQEVTAAKAAGINVLSLLGPAVFLGAVLSICCFLLTNFAIPWAVANIQKTVTSAMEDIFLDVLRSQHQVTNGNRGYSITVMGVEGKTLLRPTFQYAPDGGETVTLQAQEATLDFDLKQQQVMLHLVRGYIDVPGRQRLFFQREEHPFPLPNQIRELNPRHIRIRDIRQKMQQVRREVNRLQTRRDFYTGMSLALGAFDRFWQESFTRYATGLSRRREALAELNTEVHSRIALSTSCLFFVLLGGPVAVIWGQRHFLTSFFVCFLPIVLGYYPVLLLMLNLSKSGTVNPGWAVWVGNGLLVVASILLLRRAMRH